LKPKFDTMNSPATTQITTPMAERNMRTNCRYKASSFSTAYRRR
jgi:hypothetical protein